MLIKRFVDMFLEQQFTLNQALSNKKKKKSPYFCIYDR